MYFRRVPYCITLLLLAVLQGCTGLKDEVHVGLTGPVELQETPFYPQKKFQCGPASLAMMLGASGVPVHPDDLSVKIYLPGREGSLQPELVAAARQYGRIPYVIDGGLPSLIAEIAAGRPVLVLQNLGVEIIPVYHYAVVIGALPENTIVLRSGADRRRLMSADDFLATWERADSWGMILLKPGKLPENPDPARYLGAVNSFEIVGNGEAATAAYAAATAAWPENETAWFALGNNHLRVQRYDQAEKVFRRLLTINPNHVGALNNLAETLARKGCFSQALTLINQAAEVAKADNSPFTEAVLQTQEEITRQMAGAAQEDRRACPSASEVVPLE